MTDHAVTQIDERGIEEQEILEVITRGEVIERYPQAYPCPACLFMQEARSGEPLYVVAAYGEKYFHATVSQAMEKVLTGNEQPRRFVQVGEWDLSSLGAKAHA